MKKLISIMLVLALVFVAGCSKDEEKKAEQPKEDMQIESVEELDDNEFIEMLSTDTRPLAVMIDNDGPSSRPQIGLESAYIVYEVIVEGGASRIMALFKNNTIEKVGPIRSSRHYFLDYALEHDAIYLHAGWSPKATTDIKALGVNNINGIQGDDGVIFYRDNTYDNTYHNLYTSVKDAYEYAEKKNYKTDSKISYSWYSKEDFDLESGSTATDVSVPYSSLYTVNYKYNSADKVYDRYIGSNPHMSQTGNGLTAKNIIICHVRNYPLNDGQNKDRQEVDTVGSGKGYYVTNGKAIEITWSKSSRTAKTEYKDLEGNSLVINPGNTYIQMVPADSVITIK